MNKNRRKNSKFSFGFLIFLLFYSSIVIYGKPDDEENEYAVKNIPPNLIQDAGAVIRKKEITFEVLDESRAIHKEKTAVTIFKKEEQQYGQKILFYDNFLLIDDFDGAIYDSEGEEIRDLEETDTQDYPVSSEYSVKDTRVRTAALFYDQYPYTVEYFTEIYYDGFINWPEWYSQNTLDPVQLSKFEVIVPKDYELRYWMNRDSIQHVVIRDGNKKIYTWIAENLPQLSRDVMGDDLEDISDNVKIAPHDFVIDGYEGSMSSWMEFGAWDYNLIKDRNKLPETAVSDIQRMIKDNGNEIEKIKKIYQYMQSRTRYVSIQLGIGGWQPFEASYVHEKGYGDCKALSNYTIALLNEAGIVAYPVLINSGDDRYPLVTEFPSNQFNHVIVCVPLETDTIWLECTSQTIPFGHIDEDTENRDALMITENGGVIIRTPSSKPEDNSLERKILVSLSSSGSAETDITINWSGNQQDYTRASVVKASHEEKKEFISNMLQVPDLKLADYKFEGLEEKLDEIKASIKISLSRYASITGSRLFFKPSLMERRTYVPKDISQRKSPVRFDYPYLDIDSIYYTLPDGYKVEALPKEVNIEASFGKFISKAELIDEKNIFYIRTIEINTYSIPAENYKEYREFFSEVVKSDRAQVVLVKK